MSDMSEDGFEPVTEKSGEPGHKALREKAGLGVAALAESTLIPAARLEDLERGAAATADELDAIGEALSVPPSRLVGR